MSTGLEDNSTPLGESPVYYDPISAFDTPQAVRSESTSSSSEIAWGTISFLILWCLGLLLLGTVLALGWQNNKRLRATSTNASAAVQEEPDVEASKNNHQEQTDDFVVASSYHDRGPSRLSLAIPMFAAVTAFCVSILSHTSCEYLLLLEQDNAELLSLGLWKVAYAYDDSRAAGLGGQDQCYSNFRSADFQVDTALTVARVAAVLASTIGGICMLVLLYYNIIASAKLGSLGRLAWPLLAAAFFQGLTLSIHASDQCLASASCSLEYGALSAITSTFYWFLCAVASILLL
jgi:hypothetical protein